MIEASNFEVNTDRVSPGPGSGIIGREGVEPTKLVGLRNGKGPGRLPGETGQSPESRVGHQSAGTPTWALNHPPYSSTEGRVRNDILQEI